MSESTAKVTGTNKRGRPLSSAIRQNLVDLLCVLGSANGYDLSKEYPKYFPRCTQRVIYHHLHKGVSIGAFSVDRISVESGSYSWGPTSEKIFYSLGPNAAPKTRTELSALTNKKKL